MIPHTLGSMTCNAARSLLKSTLTTIGALSWMCSAMFSAAGVRLHPVHAEETCKTGC